MEHAHENSATLSKKIHRQLLQYIGIGRPIIQFETAPCGEGGMFCEMSRGAPENKAENPEVSIQKNAKSPLFKKPLLFWVRLGLGVIFIIASIDKIYQPAAFAQMIYNYQILPDAIISIMALILPWLEVFLGLLLIFGFWLPGTAILTNILLVAFFGALLFNTARGLNIHCGCFSTSTEGDPATAWYLLRDASFLLMGGYIFFKVLIKHPPALLRISAHEDK